MKLTVSKKADAIKDTGNGGGYINNSGIYDVTLNFVQVATSKGGAHQLNFNLDFNGNDQTIYGPYITDKAGNVNEITQNLLNRLCIISGMQDGQDIETETTEVALGKDKKLTDIEVIPELSDLACKIRVQMEYSLYNNEIQERKNIKAFYREDGATAAEAEANENIGKRIALDEEKYASNVTYKDGLTEQDVKDWLQAKRDGKAATTPAAKPAAKRPMFGKK